MSFTLSAEELKGLAELLKRRFTYATLKDFLFFDLERFIEDVSLGQDLGEVIGDTLRKAVKEAWLGELVERLAVRFPDEPDLRLFSSRSREETESARIYSWYPLNHDHFKAWFLRRRVSFVDREDLREEVTDLCKSAGATVLIISGPRGCGKSYSCRYIDYICKQLLGVEPVLVDLKKWPPKSCQPLDLIRSIGVQLDYGEPFYDKTAQQWRQKQQLFDWLIGRIRTHPGFLWLVIDGYGQALLPAETEELIQELADAADVRFSEKLRLVLTGHSGEDLPSPLLNFARHVPVRPLQSDDYRDFFQRLFQLRGESVVPEGLAAAVQTVEDKLAEDPLNPKPPHLAVSEVVEDLFGL